MKKRKWNVCLGMVLVIGLIVTGCASGDGAAGNGSAASENLDNILRDVHGHMKRGLIEGGVFTEDEFEEGYTIPGYAVTSMNRGDDGFDDYVDALGIEKDAVRSLIHIQPMMNTRSENILILLADDKGKAEEGLRAYHEGQDNMWSTYLPDQYDLVKKNISGTKGDVVYYITHEDADALEDVILERVK